MIAYKTDLLHSLPTIQKSIPHVKQNGKKVIMYCNLRLSLTKLKHLQALIVKDKYHLCKTGTALMKIC